MKLAILALAALAAAAQSFAPASDKPLRISVDDVTYASAPQLYVVPGTGISYSMSCVSGKCSLTINAATDANQAANLVKAGPASGADAAPTYRALVAADMPKTSVAAVFPWGYPVAYSNATAPTANRVYASRFVLLSGITVSKIGAQTNTASGTCAGTCGFVVGVYSADKNTLLATSTVVVSGGSPNLNTSNLVMSVSLTSSVSLPPGDYWLAWTTDSTALRMYQYSVSNPSVDVYNVISSNNGYAANASTGSGASISLPSALGAITATRDAFLLVCLGN